LDVPEIKLLRGFSYVMTGTNGSGKTTLLRILGGLEAAQIASFEFDGSQIPIVDICARLAPRVVYLHQHPYLFSTSVAANVAYGLKSQVVPHREQAAVVEEAMSWAGVQHLAHISPHRL